MAMPASIQPLLEHAVPFTLVLFRIAGVFVIAPLLTSVVVPMRIKTLIAVMLAAASYPVVRQTMSAPVSVDVFGLVGLIVSEALIGLIAGVIAAIPLLSLELAGVAMGQSIGFGLARVYNPESDMDTDLLGQLLLYIATGVFLAAGGLERLFGGVLRSFETLPVGSLRTDAAPLDVVAGAVTSGFDLALRVSLPVVGMTLLLVIVLGVVGKTMPQLNIMTVGFTIKIIAGLAIFAASVFAVREAVGDEIESGLRGAMSWLSAAQGGR